jgi:hypothetical protein
MTDDCINGVYGTVMKIPTIGFGLAGFLDDCNFTKPVNVNPLSVYTNRDNRR